VIPGERCEGRAAILDRLFSAPVAREPQGERRLTVVRHHLTTSKIDFTGPTEATGRSYFLVLTDIGIDHSGVYVDEYRRRDGRWWITKREVRIDFVAENAVFGRRPEEAVRRSGCSS
jgi:hypothetical protein